MQIKDRVEAIAELHARCVLNSCCRKMADALGETHQTQTITFDDNQYCVVNKYHITEDDIQHKND